DGVIEASHDGCAVGSDDRTVHPGRHAEFNDFHSWITDRKKRRALPGRMERAGYASMRNADRQTGKDAGLWRISGKRQMVYARKGPADTERSKAPAPRLVR